MSKPQKESFFWTSYSDLMTSLFFVMLVLFVLVIVLLHNKMMDIEKERQATQVQLDKIREMETSIEKIDSTYFQYDANFKRHTLKNIDVSFQRGSSDINDISQRDRDRLCDAGRSIIKFVQDAVKINPEVKYLLIIEGQSSRDDFRGNDTLSYSRALALVKYWKKDSISFNNKNCEIIISGSGQESPFRIIGNEALNQRFVIHIIPKTGVIEK